MLRTILLLTALGTIFIYPAFLLLLTFINFFVVAVKNLLTYFISDKNNDNISKRKPSQKDRFVSVLVAIHNEPPLLVNNTLLSLSKQNYKNYEVLVLDNNTTDKAMWLPVQKFCNKLGEKFKFYHIENLEGFKAGALNWLMKKVHNNAEFVAIIDADYQADPNFLASTITYFTDKKIAFVQLPQAYANVSEQNKGLAVEYEYFFDNYMKIAQKLRCVNATGTLGIFNIKLLKKLGGFNTSTITEDAELGTRIALAGYRGVYIPKIMGRGLMPHSLSDLKKQRIRWAIGNAQVLRKYLFAILKSQNLAWRQKLSLYSQLLAWANFTFPATFLIIIISTLKLLSLSTRVWDIVFIVCISTIIIFLFLKLVSFFITFRKKYNISIIFRAFLVHIGINYIYSIRYFSGLLDFKFNFIRTNKFLNKNVSDLLTSIIDELIFLFFISGLAIGLLFVKEYIYFFALLIIITMTLTVFFTLKEATATQIESKKFFSKIQNSELNQKI